ncbi:ABC transporter permease [Profundibacter amoris]|uniref:ABC transporter permease n=1 Tax=Profundibacter amoris TaxID=2171755 RepID=A0A347UEE0_9RHOB|nr:ABC transporter permease [Profundibacter amoris]AXX97218.1 ABC transporter permease [Profundibacter amoris]
MNKSIIPVLTVVAMIMVIWYAASIWMNSKWVYDQAARAGEEVSFSELVKDTWSQDRPVLPAPHQIVQELYKSTVLKKVTSKRSLVFHGWITLSATLLGFIFGTGMGILLAIGIVHNRAMDMSVMPWAIASQTVPIIAIAPMIVVVMSTIGATDFLGKGAATALFGYQPAFMQGLLPKAVIAAYLSFFPVVVGMVKGLRSPDNMQLDLLKTYNASKARTFWSLRLPSSTPYLFTSLKIGMAGALVGAIVSELSASPLRGLGARMLTGSYYGQTIQIWAALFAAAAMAATLVGIIGMIERYSLQRMGMVK